MSDDNVANLESKREALLDAYDDLCDEIVESLYALPQDLKRDVISAVCCEHDWSHFAEYIVWSMTQGATKQTEISIRTEDKGAVVVSLIPEKVVRGRA